MRFAKNNRGWIASGACIALLVAGGFWGGIIAGAWITAHKVGWL